MTVPLSKEGEPPPVVRIRSEGGTAWVLRGILLRHNLRVAALAVGTLVAALVAWSLLYFLSTWAVIFIMTVVAPDRDRIPSGFPIVFGVVAISAIAYAWVDQWLTPNARPRDELRIGEVIVDFILAVPRMTLAVGGTLRAWQHLSGTELMQAAALLHRLAEEKRVPMSGMRVEIPDPDTAMRVLFALQLTEIIEVHRSENEFWLRLNALRPKSLRAGRDGFVEA
jgi:hypothetical protein